MLTYNDFTVRLLPEQLVAKSSCSVRLSWPEAAAIWSTASDVRLSIKAATQLPQEVRAHLQLRAHAAGQLTPATIVSLSGPSVDQQLNLQDTLAIADFEGRDLMVTLTGVLRRYPSESVGENMEPTETAAASMTIEQLMIPELAQ